MFIQLPVFLIEADDEDAIVPQKKKEPEEVLISINVNHIASHWQGLDGYTHFTLSDTREHISDIDYDDFVEIVNEYVMTIEFKGSVN